jgi:PIN domain nuclease of toxin-antitoxin system
MRLVLDTCALVAFTHGEPMARDAIDAIDSARSSTTAYVPSVTAMEIAQKWSVGKLRLLHDLHPRAFFQLVAMQAGFRELSVSSEVALTAYELPEPFHRDPADRLIVAMARLLDAPVITVDRQMVAYGRLGHVRIIEY